MLRCQLDLKTAKLRGSSRRGAEAGGHPVPGVGGLLLRGSGLLPGTGAGRVLETCQQVGRGARHDRISRR